jgi:hypothetical protein
MPDVALTEKRKVGSSTLPLTTSFGRVSSTLTSANADWALSCLLLSSDHECPCVTVVGRSLSHADRTSCLGAPVSRPLRPELARPRRVVLTGRPSVFQAAHNPSRHKIYLRIVLSPVAAVCRWSLLLLSPLLSAQPSSSGGKLTRTAGPLGPRTGSGAAELRITRVFSCVAHRFKTRASLMFAGRCWCRSLAVDGRSGTSRGHAPVMRRPAAR